MKTLRISELYYGAKVSVNVDGEIVKTTIKSISPRGIEVDSASDVYFKSSEVYGIELDGLYINTRVLSNGDLLEDQNIAVRYNPDGNNWIVFDVEELLFGQSFEERFITTVNYVHEFEKLVELLTGYFVIDKDDLAEYLFSDDL